jgi:small subunit ribosomal protein S4
MGVSLEREQESNMGRYTGPKTRLSRREGQDLLLKGAKTFTDKNPLKRKPQAPGQHGLSRKRLSGYGVQLREKQKVKRMYGIYEKQFKNYYIKSTKTKGVTGDVLLAFLESRVDNIIYRSGIADTRAQARKYVTQGKAFLNGKQIFTPSIIVKPGEIITFDEKLKIAAPEDHEAPAWLTFNKSKGQIKVKHTPLREDIKEELNEQLIIEYYSR